MFGRPFISSVILFYLHYNVPETHTSQSSDANVTESLYASDACCLSEAIRFACKCLFKVVFNLNHFISSTDPHLHRLHLIASYTVPHLFIIFGFVFGLLP